VFCAFLALLRETQTASCLARFLFLDDQLTQDAQA
jgi:hypothetical protein